MSPPRDEMRDEVTKSDAATCRRPKTFFKKPFCRKDLRVRAIHMIGGNGSSLGAFPFYRGQ